MPATILNSPSKEMHINNMNKPELMEETRYHRQKEEEYGKLIKELKKDVKEIEGEVNEIRNRRISFIVRDDFESRAVQIERRLGE